MSVTVVGAGIAGLACARALTRAGVAVRVLERARVPGGRLASRRFAGRPVDLGAAYFTVDDPGFAEVVDAWRAAGLARPWTDTLRVYDGGSRRSSTGPPRWAAVGGLRSLAEQLAEGLDLTLEHPVAAVAAGHTAPDGPTVDGEPAEAVVLAMPGPQALRLLAEPLSVLRAVACAQRWSPALSVVLRYPRRRWADFAGMFVNGHPIITRVCDDGDRRGDRAPVLVAHSTAAFAAAHLDAPAAAADPVEAAVRQVLDLPEPADDVHVHRWSHAEPHPADPAPADGPAPADTPGGGAPAGFHLDAARVALAGDAFGVPRVQTAWLSGHRLGVALAQRLTAPADRGRR